MRAKKIPVTIEITGIPSVMPYQNRFPVFRNKKHSIGAYAMLPFQRATAYNSLIA